MQSAIRTTEGLQTASSGSTPNRVSVSIPTTSEAIRLHLVGDEVWGASAADIKVFVTGSVAYWDLVGVDEPEQEQKFEYLNQSEIDAVMLESPGLRSLVDEACAVLFEAFKGDAISLRSSTDPEQPGKDTLVLKVKTSKDYDEAIEVWQRFNEEWWIPNYDRGDDRFCILLDF
jgi:hypothetical protein